MANITGHFMCAQVKEAKRLALIQHDIAMKLHNYHLAARCKIHLAYSDIRLGNFKSAALIFYSQIEGGRKLEDENLVEMCTAGLFYIKQLVKKLRAHHFKLPQVADKTKDEYYRQRIIDGEAVAPISSIVEVVLP
jgi:hypothetical protein